MRVTSTRPLSQQSAVVDDGLLHAATLDDVRVSQARGRSHQLFPECAEAGRLAGCLPSLPLPDFLPPSPALHAAHSASQRPVVPSLLPGSDAGKRHRHSNAGMLLALAPRSSLGTSTQLCRMDGRLFQWQCKRMLMPCLPKVPSPSPSPCLPTGPHHNHMPSNLSASVVSPAGSRPGGGTRADSVGACTGHRTIVTSTHRIYGHDRSGPFRDTEEGEFGFACSWFYWQACSREWAWALLEGGTLSPGSMLP